MNLFSLLNRREKPIPIGIIGAGKFATMFFAQALKIPSFHIVGVVDIVPAYIIKLFCKLHIFLFL